MLVFLNNQFVEEKNAFLHISDLATQRGYGIFDFFRVRNNVLLYVEDHLDRFEKSASLMHLEIPYPKTKLLSILKDLVLQNTQTDSGIRMILTGGYSEDAYNPTTPNFIIIQRPLNIADSLIPKPIHVITQEYVREIPEAKTINYTMGIWLQQKIKERNADDVLYHHNGHVSEFPRCNFFIVNKENHIVTPDKNILKGVTRKKIIECASSTYHIKEAPITIQDVYQAKEAFLTSSTKRIQAITKIDNQKIGDGKPGEVTTSLLSILLKEEQNYITKQS